MRIFFANYELKGKAPSVSRNGVLLRVHFDKGWTGYADCHPWVELGDKPLAEQLNLLSTGTLTPLTKQSLHFAKIDGEARANGENLFANLSIPPSHWFLSNLQEEIPKDFTLGKIKLGRNPDKELRELPGFFKSLPERVSVRLDFNNRIKEQTFSKFLDILEPFTNKIDFIEDPFAYDASAWEKIQKCYSLKLACDFKSAYYSGNIHSHSISVIKPAVQESAAQSDPHHLVYTSYLDHPFGQLSAAYTAAVTAGEYPEKVLTCGLMTHTVYQTNKYSEELDTNGNRLLPPSDGSGFGFDEQLKSEKWTELK